VSPEVLHAERSDAVLEGRPLRRLLLPAGGHELPQEDGHGGALGEVRTQPVQNLPGRAQRRSKMTLFLRSCFSDQVVYTTIEEKDSR
jgi:hypothetical protein